MPDITMKREHTDRWTKMRLSRARSSGPAASCHMLSSVDCITTTSESEFSVHTGWRNRSWRHSQSTVARYMCRRFGPPSQGWRTFLANHAHGIAAVDLFVLPTITFQTLYCLLADGVFRIYG